MSCWSLTHNGVYHCILFYHIKVRVSAKFCPWMFSRIVKFSMFLQPQNHHGFLTVSASGSSQQPQDAPGIALTAPSVAPRRTSNQSWGSGNCIYVSMYLCIYVSMYRCIDVSMYRCIDVSMYLCIYVSMYLCIYVSMYLCILCMYVCIYVCMYVCSYVAMQLCSYLSIYLSFYAMQMQCFVMLCYVMYVCK